MIGHDLHDGLAGRNHGPRRMDGELVDDAVLRRPEVDVSQLILYCNAALGIFAAVALGLSELLGYLTSMIVPHLDNLQLCFGDLALDFGCRGNEAAELSVKSAASRCKA